MGLLLDDRIWLWSIAAECFNTERCSGDTERPGDIVLSSMLRTGLHNWSESERPSEALTRSMRYAVCLADRLWEGIESKGTKVLFPALPACRETNSEGSEKLSKLRSPFKSDSAWLCTLGASSGVPTRNTASTSQGNGQCTSNDPTWNTANTFEFPTQFTSDDPSWDMHSTLTVFQVM